MSWQTDVFLGLCLLTAWSGALLQVVALVVIRRGTPTERVAASLGGDRDWQLNSQVWVLERELLIDFGNALVAVATLLIASSVIAGLALNVPYYWRVAVAAFAISLFAAIYAAWTSTHRLFEKRVVQQHIFEAIGSDTPLHSYRNDLLQLRSDLRSWKQANQLRRVVLLFLYLFDAARRNDISLKERFRSFFP